MPYVTIRDLQRNANEVVAAVTSTGRLAVITKQGRPVAAVVPISDGDLEDWALADSPGFVTDRQATDNERAAGNTVSLDDLAEIGEIDGREEVLRADQVRARAHRRGHRAVGRRCRGRSRCDEATAPASGTCRGHRPADELIYFGPKSIEPILLAASRCIVGVTWL